MYRPPTSLYSILLRIESNKGIEQNLKEFSMCASSVQEIHRRCRKPSRVAAIRVNVAWGARSVATFSQSVAGLGKRRWPAHRDAARNAACGPRSPHSRLAAWWRAPNRHSSPPPRGILPLTAFSSAPKG